jgi:hypothetical protein
MIIAHTMYNLSFGQTLRHPIAANYIGIGPYSTTNADVFSFTANQASLATIKSVSIGVYGERRFMLNELNLYNAAFTLPTHSGNFGLKAGYYGFAAYNETQAGLAYARSLSSKIDIGVQFNYNGIKVAGYGSAAAITFEAGMIMHLTDKLNAGVHINNPTTAKYNKGGNEKLPFVYSAGLGYEASQKFFVSAEMEKEENQPVNIKAGIQYKFIQQLLARAAISTATSSASLAIGISIRSFRIEVITSYHPQLGITPGLLLLFNLSSSSKSEITND